MQFHKNTLIHNPNVISTMESIADNQFQCVYLDLPRFTGVDAFIYDGSIQKENLFRENNSNIIIRERDKKEQISNQAQKAEFETYGAFISKILENAKRILSENGMLVFRAPAMPTIDYKLMLDQVFSNTYVKQITIELEKTFTHKRNVESMNHETLYFYSKSKHYTLNKVFESFDSIEEQYPYQDERDRYRLYPLLQVGSFARFDYTWKGITPAEKLKWIYNQDKLDKFYLENRIVLKEDKAYLKRYMKENLKEKSSVWKAKWSVFFGISEVPTNTMKAENFIDMISMVTHENDWIFAPYDTDQKLPVIAQHMQRRWVTINPLTEKGKTYQSSLNDESFIKIRSITSEKNSIAYNKLLKNIEDINHLKSRLSILHASVVDIKKQLGVKEESEETIIEKIQEKIDEMIHKSDIESYIPVVQSWIKPYWDKLEHESQLFLPTAELLFKEYKDSDQFDLTTAVIQYCKSLEKELFSKMFIGYIKKLIANGTHIKNTFPNDFDDSETKYFTETVRRFTTRYKNNENKWHFELGTMVYILKIVLGDERSPLLKKGRILYDFKLYIEGKFEKSFFDIGFLLKLDNIVKLRNESSHPYIVTPERVKDGKELTKQKIIDLLKYYKE